MGPRAGRPTVLQGSGQATPPFCNSTPCRTLMVRSQRRRNRPNDPRLPEAPSMRATNHLPTLHCLIGGQPVASDAIAEVRDPGTGELIALVTQATLQMADAAVFAAHTAFPDWAASEHRPVAMIHCAEVVAAHADELAELLSREQGKPLVEASREIARLGQWLRHFASIALETAGLVDNGARRVRVVRRPLGVVARHNSMELPDLAAWLEARTGIRGREHGRGQAIAIHAGDDTQARWTARRRAAAGRAQRCDGRSRSRGIPGWPPTGSQSRVHGERQYGPFDHADRRAGTQASHARTWRQRSRDRA